MHYIPASVVFLSLWVGCGDQEKSTYGEMGSSTVASVESDSGVPPFCDDMEVEVNGRNIETVGDPSVGDTWQIRMFCHESLMTGANILQFAPPSRATVAPDMTDATFVQPGTTAMLLQSGNIQFRTEFNVLAAP